MHPTSSVYKDYLEVVARHRDMSELLRFDMKTLLNISKLYCRRKQTIL